MNNNIVTTVTLLAHQWAGWFGGSTLWLPGYLFSWLSLSTHFSQSSNAIPNHGKWNSTVK